MSLVRFIGGSTLMTAFAIMLVVTPVHGAVVIEHVAVSANPTKAAQLEAKSHLRILLNLRGLRQFPAA